MTVFIQNSGPSAAKAAEHLHKQMWHLYHHEKLKHKKQSWQSLARHSEKIKHWKKQSWQSYHRHSWPKRWQKQSWQSLIRIRGLRLQRLQSIYINKCDTCYLKCSAAFRSLFSPRPRILNCHICLCKCSAAFAAEGPEFWIKTVMTVLFQRLGPECLW